MSAGDGAAADRGSARAWRIAKGLAWSILNRIPEDRAIMMAQEALLCDPAARRALRTMDLVLEAHADSGNKGFACVLGRRPDGEIEPVHVDERTLRVIQAIIVKTRRHGTIGTSGGVAGAHAMASLNAEVARPTSATLRAAAIARETTERMATSLKLSDALERAGMPMAAGLARAVGRETEGGP